MLTVINSPLPQARIPGQEFHHPIYESQVTVQLKAGEKIDAEPGAFLAGRGVTMETAMSGKSCWSVFKRMFFSGESLFTNTFKAQEAGAWLSLATPKPGHIAEYYLDPISQNKINLVAGSYLASSPNVELTSRFDRVIDWKGTGLMKFQASLKDGLPGKVFFHSDNSAIVPIEVNPAKPVVVDNNHVLAFTEGLDCKVRLLGKKAFSFFASGEGYVCEFSGKGTLFVRTHAPVRPARANG